MICDLNIVADCSILIAKEDLRCKLESGYLISHFFAHCLVSLLWGWGVGMSWLGGVAFWACFQSRKQRLRTFHVALDAPTKKQQKQHEQHHVSNLYINEITNYSLFILSTETHSYHLDYFFRWVLFQRLTKCVLTAAKQRWTTSNWRYAPLANSWNIAALTVRRIIGRSIKKRVRKDWLSCTMMNYSPSPIAPIWENVQSASCRCRLGKVKIHFFHAAWNWFVTAVTMPITYNTEAILVPSAENRQ